MLDEDDGVGGGGGGVTVSSDTKLGVDSLARLNSLLGQSEIDDVGDDTEDEDSSSDHDGDVGLIG